MNKDNEEPLTICQQRGNKAESTFTRYGDVDLADGHVPIVIERHVLHHRVLEHSQRGSKTVRLHLQSRDAAAVVDGRGFGEVHGQQPTVRALLHHDRLLRAILKHRRLVVHARREPVVVAQQRLRHWFLAAHQFKLQTRVVHVADNPKNDEPSLHVLGQRDHRQFPVIARVPHRQIEVGKVDDVVFDLGLFVEEPNLRWPADDVVSHHPLHQNRLHPVNLAEIDAHVREGLLLAAPAGHRVQTNVPRLVIRSF